MPKRHFEELHPCFGREKEGVDEVEGRAEGTELGEHARCPQGYGSPGGGHHSKRATYPHQHVLLEEVFPELVVAPAQLDEEHDVRAVCVGGRRLGGTPRVRIDVFHDVREGARYRVDGRLPHGVGEDGVQRGVLDVMV